MHCANNLKQIGLAIASYTANFNSLPPGSIHSGTNRDDPKNHHMNWAIAILPHLEQQNLFDKYNQDVYNSHPDNRPVLRTFLSVMECPSDNHRRKLVVPAQVPTVGPEGIASGSYKGVSGARWGATNGFFDYPGFAPSMLNKIRFRGPLHLTQVSKLGPVTPAHIRDGLSNTLLVGEYCTLDTKKTDATGVALWASTHSFHNLGSPQRESYTRISDYDRCLQLNGNRWWQCDRSFASMHGGGIIQFVLCDGSVRSFGQNVEGTLFESLATIAGDEVVQLP
jgi:hypothetical protein